MVGSTRGSAGTAYNIVIRLTNAPTAKLVSVTGISVVALRILGTAGGNGNVGRGRTGQEVDAVDLYCQSEATASKVGDCVGTTGRHLGHKPGLRVAYSIGTCSHNGHLVSGFLAPRVDANLTVKVDKVVSGRASFNLQHDIVIGRIVLVVGDTNKGPGNLSRVDDVNLLLAVIVPTNLESLGRVPALSTTIVGVPRVAHVS